MRKYESVTILRPTLTDEEVEAEVQAVSNLIQSSGGEVLEVERWGRRRLAYEIDKVHEGIYTLYLFNGTPQTIQEMERRYRLDEKLLRHLTILSDGPPPRPIEEGEGADGDGREERGGHRDFRDRRDRREPVIED